MGDHVVRLVTDSGLLLDFAEKLTAEKLKIYIGKLQINSNQFETLNRLPHD